MASGSRLVLVADDDEGARIALTQAVEAAGFSAIEARDGGEIWPILERESLRALLLDLKMPGMNGWEVLRRLRNDFRFRGSRSDFSVVVVSGQCDPSSRDFALALGADGFLAKPVDWNALASHLTGTDERNAAPRG